MLYSDNPKIIFVAIPKTGTRAIYDVLKKHFNGKMHKDHVRVIPSKFRKHFSFVVTRNPYDRICSMWWSTCKRGYDRHGFIKEMKQRGLENTLNSFVTVIRDSEKEDFRISHPMNDFFVKNKIDAKLRFESLEEDFNKLPFVTKYIKLPSLNVTQQKTSKNPIARPPWQTLLDEESIKIINELYADDFGSEYDMIIDYESWKKQND